MRWLYLLGTITCAVVGQILIKWRVDTHGPMPGAWRDKFWFYADLLSDGYVIGAFALAFLSALFWMATVTQFALNLAYPLLIVSLLLLTVASSTLLLHESFSLAKALGIALIMVGTVVISRFG